jgi:hypothetical protein
VNVAARLEQAASPGEVLIGAATHRLVRDAVDVELLPPLEAKGKSEPLTAYRLLGLTGDEAHVRRFDAPLVGRTRESRLLADAWERVRSERACSLFTVLGAAGVGKSRLAQEFLAGVDATVVSTRCLSYGEGITYWPAVEIVEQLLQNEEPDDPGLRALLGRGHASNDDIAFGVRKLLEARAANARSWSCWTTCTGGNRLTSTSSSMWPTGAAVRRFFYSASAGPSCSTAVRAGVAASSTRRRRCSSRSHLMRRSS